MKFLNVFCERRQAPVFISLDKIVMIRKADDRCLIDLLGLSDGDGPVVVAKEAEDLIRMINGEDKTAIGFRTGR